MKLHDRHIILTGASGGIGSEVATLLAKNGAHIVLVDRNAETLEKIRADIAAYGTRIIIIAADLTSDTGRRLVIDQARKGLGEIDMLINLAGVMSFTDFPAEDPAITELLFKVNVLAPMQLSQALLPYMIAQGRGQIVNIGSIFGSIAFAYFATYSSTKFALRGFSEALRRELEGTGINVTYIAPRAARTAFNTGAINKMSSAVKMNMDSPATVATHIIRAIEKDSKDYYIGWPESLFVRINALFPRVVDQAVKKQNQITRDFAREH
jgi:short-subunit dehydrogenase